MGTPLPQLGHASPAITPAPREPEGAPASSTPSTDDVDTMRRPCGEHTSTQPPLESVAATTKRDSDGAQVDATTASRASQRAQRRRQEASVMAGAASTRARDARQMLHAPSGARRLRSSSPTFLSGRTGVRRDDLPGEGSNRPCAKPCSVDQERSGGARDRAPTHAKSVRAAARNACGTSSLRSGPSAVEPGANGRPSVGA